MAINPSPFPKITIPFDKVVARLGYARGRTRIDEKTGLLVREEIERGEKLLAPGQVIASSPIAAAAGKVRLEPGLVVESRDIAALLENCAEAFGFAVTVGPAIERKRDDLLARRENARALVLDAVGSAAAEELAELTTRQIALDVRGRHLTVTRRFSPGYGDWPLAAQREFLAWLGAAKIGIRLTENCQMLPEKSVSAILGAKQE